MHEPEKVTARGLTNLFIVYLVWGSTYLAIRVAVRPGAGVPPFTLGFGRTLVAGALLLIWGFLRKGAVRPTRRELAVFAGSGLLLWTGANGMVAWAEQRIDSSFAAVLIATTPLWTVAIESIMDRRKPPAKVWVALLVGFAGTVVLSAPKLRADNSGDFLSIFVLILAPLTWALGTLLQRRNPSQLPARVSAGYQLIFAAMGFAVLMLLAGEGMPRPTPEALLAWVYLIVFGSIFAFTAFVSMVRELPTSLAMTYAYVNPVIAVFLGAWLLSEALTIPTLIGSGLVLLGVVGVFKGRSPGS
ncbi:MAG: EamA family transporter [Anaerolineales bacterium]|nr:MAG: EamA family transporter [Anaerolineales bacterium]